MFLFNSFNRNFACPENGTLVQHIPRRDFTTHLLSTYDPEGYTEFMPNLMTEIRISGIYHFFPAGFTLNFTPLIPPAIGATDAQIEAYNAMVRANDHADHGFPSKFLQIRESLNERMLTYLESCLPDGTYPPGTLPFTQADCDMLMSVNSSYSIEESDRNREFDLVGPFLIRLKKTLSPSLIDALDVAIMSMSDHPIPKRINNVLREFLQHLEVVCRGNEKKCISIIFKRFNDIGAAFTREQCIMVVEQFDRARHILLSYVYNHPDSVQNVPTDKMILHAIIYRFQNDELLESIRESLQEKFDDPSTVYDYLLDSTLLKRELSEQPRANIFTSVPSQQSANLPGFHW